MPDAPTIVTPLAETAEPVEALDTTPSPQPEAEAPEAASPAAEPVEGRSQESPAAEEQPKADPPKPEKTLREQLIDQLTGVEEPKSTVEDEDPTPPADKQDPAPTKPEDTKPEEIPEDLVEVTNDDIKAMKPGEGRRKINRLIKRLKDAEPYAQGYKEIVDTCAANNFSPDDYKAWVGIGIGLQRGDPQAVAMFQQIATKAGITPAPAGISAEVETWLDAQVKDLEISATAAAELRKRLGAKAPQPAPQPQAAPPQPAPQPRAAPQPPVDHARASAEQALDKVAAEYEAKLGAARFAELEPRIMAGLKARKGVHPAAWADTMRAVIEIELAKLPKPAAIQSNLRPGGKAGSSTPSFKTERERVLHRLTSG